jgi:hypothetical protein
MKTAPALFVTLLCALLVGCHTNTGTISREPVSYFQVVNVKPGFTAIVDENPPVALDTAKGKATLKVSPGKHRIRLMQGSVAIVDRIVLISDLQTLEIAAP